MSELGLNEFDAHVLGSSVVNPATAAGLTDT